MVGRVADVVVLSGEERRFLATQILQSATDSPRYRALQSATERYRALVVGPVPHDTAVRRRFSE